MWFQCQQCGYLHKEKIRDNSENLYIKIECPKCRGETKHVCVGEHKEDVYLYGNLNVDPRYYNKKTIQSDYTED